MVGKVNARLEAMLKIRVRGWGRARRTVHAIIDSGYTGTLTLPPRIVKALGLKRVAQSDAKLADGRLVSFDVYAALVEWDGKLLPLLIDQSPAEPLIGMSLLAGHDLKIRVKPRGPVSILRF